MSRALRQAEKKRRARADRFGLEVAIPAGQQVVVASAGGEIDLPRGCVEEPTHPSGETRVEAIHIYGSDNMSTDQVMNLFADYVPSHLEWINDSSCNVVWQVRT
jgi:hypothetical protein